MYHHILFLKRLVLGMCALAASLALCTSQAWADSDAPFQPRYQVINLGNLRGNASSALGINASGQVAGWSTTAAGQRHAFMYSGGLMEDLGTFSGGTSSQANAISDTGIVVGSSGINGVGPGFPEIQQGFIWQQGKMSSVGALYCPCSFNVRYGTSSLSGINDFGQAAGWSETVRGSWVLHAAQWKASALADFGGGAGDWSISRVFAVNDAGQMVGDYALNAGQLGSNIFDRQASLWQSDGTREDLGTLPDYDSSSAVAINSRGTVVGWSGTTDGSASRAFLWHKGRMTDLGVLPGYANSMALALNAVGEVVGWSNSADGTLSHAFLWYAGRMYDLNDLLPPGSGWVLNQAAGINVLGQIVGTGIYNGQTCAYILRPIYAWNPGWYKAQGGGR